MNEVQKTTSVPKTYPTQIGCGGSTRLMHSVLAEQMAENQKSKKPRAQHGYSKPTPWPSN